MKQADKPKQTSEPRPSSEKDKPDQGQQPSQTPEENTGIVQTGIVQPMIDELRYPKDAPETPKAPPRGPVHPPQPAELDQDAGGGYNPDHTYPQT